MFLLEMDRLGGMLPMEAIDILPMLKECQATGIEWGMGY